MEYIVEVKLDKYIFKVPVSVVESNGEYVYFIKEPACNELCRDLKDKILEVMRKKDLDILSAMNYVLERYGNNVSRSTLQATLYHILRDTKGYGALTVPICDPNVEEIELSNHNHVVTIVHRKLRNVKRLLSNVKFRNEIDVRELIQVFIRKGITRGISLAKPYVETILPEGHRLVATIGEITPGPTFSIRKFPARPYTLKDLVEMSMLDYVTAAYLWLVAEYRGFIIISGPMGSGKTTLLSAIASMLPKDAKIVTIEDTPEIKLPHKNWVRMFTREGFDEKIEIGMFSLVKLAVRYRPDYIIVGEVRGDEVHAMFQAAALGHGMLTTFHASTIEEFITRLTTPPLNINIGNLQLVWCIVFTSIHNGVRKVVNIVEPYVKNGQIHFNKVFDEGKVMIGQSMKLKNLKETYSIDIEEEVKRRIELIRSEEAQPHPSR